MLNTGQQPPPCAGCPLYGESYGFALDYGDPLKSRLALMLEAPGKDEITYDFRHGQFGELDAQELDRRRRDYPALGPRFLSRGAALVGASWRIMAGWVLKRFGIRREELFISNTLRCLPPRSGKTDTRYPTGETRKFAESFCRQYDRIGLYRPSIVFVTFHPASLSGQKRDITPLPLLIHTIEKAVDAARQGFRPLVLCGGKATKAWLGWGETVTKWQGTYSLRQTCAVTKLYATVPRPPSVHSEAGTNTGEPLIPHRTLSSHRSRRSRPCQPILVP